MKNIILILFVIIIASCNSKPDLLPQQELVNNSRNFISNTSKTGPSINSSSMSVAFEGQMNTKVLKAESLILQTKHGVLKISILKDRILISGDLPIVFEASNVKNARPGYEELVKRIEKLENK